MSQDRHALRLTPFRATRYAPDLDLSRVICPPYDVIDDRALERFEAADAHNIVHVTLPRADPAADQPHGSVSRDDRYRLAAARLQRWVADGVLRTDPGPALYVYEHRTGAHTAIGLVGGVGIHGPVLPHEHTFPGPVADRSALMRATNTQLEPILLTYDGDGAASDVVDSVARQAPDQEVRTDTGTCHRIWRITDQPSLTAVASDLAGRSALIVDGHHRFAAYHSVHDAAAVPGVTDRGLALLVDAARHPLELRGVHRSITGLGLDDAVGPTNELFEATTIDTTADLPSVLAAETRTAFLVSDGTRHTLLRAARGAVPASAFPAGRHPAWQRTDAAVLTDVLLDRLWNLTDADDRVGYHHDPGDAIVAARRSAGVAILVRPPALTDVLALAAAGVRMPRKSTSFGPKPWTGLLMRHLDTPHDVTGGG